ncbi:hypothetical protein SS1G_06628 [Sclerotinia sclerotiorum 1980 UF-70]|uniref:DUF3824 domain-containing protein n=2 Tax=Sclerotinia sclerotiorum (strain ATCC 18683 / 1980 / Ss-1) TaxID=665079 RepID=A7EMS9_SCLS1|nr:hypothetical protein SS1G_06628 [Sclerotinia sclerotiorum 1980 UF-70]APA14643.1 hypothetical protein sscle_13g094130 [Sclerotinia sclerotiorum 1980 UF-70]EDO04145.1 hypothetical protein SS1G_06628 [Sclerotinia sclerotiorum 1980 UF-70]
MTSYEYEYETVEEPRRHRSHRHRKDDREPRYADEPRYVETQETYIRSAATKSPVAYAPDAPVRERERERDREVAQTRELVRQPRREDSDLSVEEVRRDFPPPAAGGAYIDQRTTVREARYGPPARRSRSVGRDGRYGEYLSDSRGDPRRSFQELDRRDDYYEDAELEDKRSLSRNQKIAAAVGGAALAVGAKELWDRRSAEGRPVERNPLASAMVGAAGALAAYEGTELYDKHGNKEKKVKKYAVHRGRNGEVQETYYSEEEEEIKPEKKKGRRKSIVDSAMALAGLGAAAKGVEHHRGRRGSGDSYYEESTSRKSRSKSRSGEGTAKYQQAAKAALLAGAAEAFRVRNEPGAWGGEKGKRILTAAIGAGGIDAAIDKDADKKSKRHILEAVVGGLVGNRAINGSRKDVEEDPVTGRSRSRSRARSRARSSSRGGGGGGGTGLAALATAGLGAIAGKKLLDRSRSRSRAGSRSRARSHSRGRRDSYSRSPSPDRNKRSRSKSVSAMARKGLAALGIGAGAGAAANEVGRNRDRSRSRNRDDYDDYSDYDDRSRRTRGQRGDVYGNPRYSESRGSVDSRGGARARDGQRNKKVAEGKNGYTSDDSLISSSEDERRVKKMKGKQFITAGLATVATIHAAHNVYSSMEKRDARHKAVQEGEMTPEEARKLRAKAALQDAASVGIAALGIKGAISEIKEANEIRHECKDFREKKGERHKKRLERQKKLAENGGRRQRDGSRSTYSPSDSRYDDRYDDRRYNSGPRYYDGNPYATGLPAPPVGYER